MSARLFFLGASVAATGLLLVPGVGAAVARAGRPVMRAAMKTGYTAYHEFRRAGAEAYEHFEDVAAEVHAELYPDDDIEADAGPGPGAMEAAGDD
ncbi:DUF5132 domain-containing protein [Roseibium aggregatum]|uniref:DUF5132 domain-containing protein n=1 Tax=Roseibium aggregatum TaxID=187304 RepID=A0A939J2N8_9HYPH|nr:DUF5132 domain-containing protein [Roseibium aggregatum]MBN9669300.1 DUF5132 domain-containing protein [Roseibium aggregatum]